MNDSTRPVALRHTYIARTAPCADLLRRRQRELARQRRLQVFVEEDVRGRERSRHHRVVGEIVGRREVVALARGTVIDARHAARIGHRRVAAEDARGVAAGVVRVRRADDRAAVFAQLIRRAEARHNRLRV